MIEGLYVSQGGPASLLRPVEPKFYNREEHLTKERHTVGAARRPPRRAQSTNDYVYPSPPPLLRGESRTVLIHHSSTSSVPQLPLSSSSSSSAAAAVALSMAENAVVDAAQPERPPTIEEETNKNVTVTGPPEEAAAATPEAAGPENGRPQRPKLGPPRRSYSVMDYEPVPHTHRPSADFGLGDLPPELHYAIFDFLDPIDSTCLGLTNKHFYAIHRRMHGTIPLSARRAGPNDMEWVWHLAGRMMQQGTTSDAAALAATTNALALLRVRGQALCRKCGVSRCELHKHIQDWMGPSYEYCTVREKFGPAALPGAKEFCYLSNPKDPHRCGRHRVPKSRPTSPMP